MLCNRIDVDGVAPQKGQQIEVGYYNILTGVWNHIGFSDSWNWQQGAMLQWLPGKGNEAKAIYNTSKDNHLVSEIVDINTGEKELLSWPIYGITPDGKKSITIDLERSFWCRAYHYQSVVNNAKEGRVFMDDGIFEINLLTNERKRIISIQEIINVDSRPYFDICKHWLEHVMISPSGDRFCFLHRFSSVDNVMKYHTRLFIADIDGRNLQLVPNWDNQSLSHFGWKSDNEFVIYTVQCPTFNLDNTQHPSIHRGFNLRKVVVGIIKAIVPEPLVRLIKSKYQGYYQYMIDDNNNVSLVKKWWGYKLEIDGHPSFTSDGRFMVTDSYPNAHGFQRLLIIDTKTDKKIQLGEIFAALKGNPASCDLHPKLCKDGKHLCIDTAYDGSHHMLVFEINWRIIEKTFS